MINVNEYLEGKVKSLGFESDGVRYTVGVLLGGEYALDSETEEHFTVTVGEFEVCVRGRAWKAVKAGDRFVIPPKSVFDLKVKKPASYVCMFR